MSLIREILGCGELDLQRAEEIAYEVGIPINELAQKIREELAIEETADPVACVYELILKRAQEKTNLKLSEKIIVYENFLDTSFVELEELSEEEEEKLKETEEGRFILKDLGKL